LFFIVAKIAFFSIDTYRFMVFFIFVP